MSKQKSKGKKAKQISTSLWNCSSFTNHYLTKKNNNVCQMSSKESWLCSFWKLQPFGRLGSLSIKTTNRWSSVLLNSFLSSLFSCKTSPSFHTSYFSHISFFLFHEFLLLLVSTHRYLFKCFHGIFSSPESVKDLSTSLHLFPSFLSTPFLILFILHPEFPHICSSRQC